MITFPNHMNSKYINWVIFTIYSWISNGNHNLKVLSNRLDPFTN